MTTEPQIVVIGVVAVLAVGVILVRRASVAPAADGDVAKEVSNGVTVVTGLLGGLGLASGLLERAYRNEEDWTKVGLALLLAATVVAFVARIAGGSHRMLLVSSVVAMAIGAMVLAMSAIEQSGANERPTITAALKLGESMVVEATARTDGLRWDESVTLTVDAVDDEPFARECAGGAEQRDTATSPTDCVTRLYQSTTGPDRDGAVTVGVTVPVPPAGYDRVVVIAHIEGFSVGCELNAPTVDDEQAIGDGCVSLDVPHVDHQPALDVALSESGELRAIDIGVTDSSVDARGLVALTVTGLAADGRPSMLYRALSASSGAGRVDDAVRVLVPRGVVEVCVTATVGTAYEPPRPVDPPVATTAGVDCLPGRESQSSWARLPVPW